MNAIERLAVFSETFTDEEQTWFAVNQILLHFAEVRTKTNPWHLDALAEECLNTVHGTVIAMGENIHWNHESIEPIMDEFVDFAFRIEYEDEEEKVYLRAEMLIKIMMICRESNEEDEGFESDEEAGEEDLEENDNNETCSNVHRLNRNQLLNGIIDKSMSALKYDFKLPYFGNVFLYEKLCNDVTTLIIFLCAVILLLLGNFGDPLTCTFPSFYNEFWTNLSQLKCWERFETHMFADYFEQKRIAETIKHTHIWLIIVSLSFFTVKLIYFGFEWFAAASIEPFWGTTMNVKNKSNKVIEMAVKEMAKLLTEYRDVLKNNFQSRIILKFLTIKIFYAAFFVGVWLAMCLIIGQNFNIIWGIQVYKVDASNLQAYQLHNHFGFDIFVILKAVFDVSDTIGRQLTEMMIHGLMEQQTKNNEEICNILIRKNHNSIVAKSESSEPEKST
ncbi:unnamed protein product [Caenorhabditis bovis]|uniref:Innexin n=1 Tax=Caenorhabditis bovis TaxID=2654633 RepID=A0A8S1EEB1_9PELO|nr:unnamed protein product [Caenorhabditis bovis]